jgi:nitronate monooxygenase
MWPDRRILDLLGVEQPILQAPMAGSAFAELAVAVAEGGGLGALACALLSVDQARAEVAAIRQRTARPIQLNFFCHRTPEADPARAQAWRDRLAPYYAELGLDPSMPPVAAARVPFDEEWLGLVSDLRPEVVSFHFGLPSASLLAGVRATGARILSSATTVAEARWLAERGVDAIIAQGLEAGGHRGMFLTDDPGSQLGTFALVPQIVDAVSVPVIAAGGIGDARGIAAALALGAAAVQLGTAYLLCPEARTAPVHRAAVASAAETVLTNVFTGRLARSLVNRATRELGPISALAPPFPLATSAILPLRAAAERAGSADFTPIWAGQAAALCRAVPAAALTRQLASEARARLAR